MQDHTPTYIEQWKLSLQTSGLFTEDQLFELEDHLHLKIDDLVADGQAKEKAFQQACLEIGHPAAIGQEYSLANKPLVIRQLAVYFLLGLPLLGGISKLFEILWQWTSIGLLELGFRSVTFSILATLPLVALALSLLIWTIKRPFWVLDIPNTFSRLGKTPLILSLSGVSFLVILTHLFYSYWVNLHQGISTISYLYKGFDGILTSGFIVYNIGLYLLSIGLMLSIIWQAIFPQAKPKSVWQKVRLLALLMGLGFFSKISVWISIGLASWNPPYFTDNFIFVQTLLFVVFLLLGSSWYYRMSSNKHTLHFE